MLFKIYFGLGLLIGVGLALRDHNGALLLGLGLSVLVLLLLEYSKTKAGGVRVFDFCKFRLPHLLFAVFLVGLALVVPLLPKIAF